MPIPESLLYVFAHGSKLIVDYTKSVTEQSNINTSIFTKTTSKVDHKTSTDNLAETRMKKAEDVYNKLTIFNTIAPNA